ncbi:MAG TPA: class E sortase [Gaiellaceae bacterium]|nr:class E sortase [Gaiellaceae bacterium]
MRRRLGIALLTLGLLTVAWVGVTVVWGDPFTSLYTAHEQHVLEKQLRVEGSQWAAKAAARTSASAAPRPTRTEDAATVLARRARTFAASLHDGEAIGRIRIPSIGLSMVVVQGTSEGDLAKGPGHYDAASGQNTALPGQGGVVAIAGHRTTFLHPFRYVNDLKPGDNVYLEMPYGTFRYRIYYQKIVTPTDWSILRKRPYEKLVLSACHPLYSASHRIVTFARLEGSSIQSVF